jgi:membrane protein DedA with SNARE-associated domain
MDDILTSLATYGYIILFVYSLGGGFVAIIAASVLAYAGKMDMQYVLIVGISANFIGDMILFYLARYNKSELKNYLSSHRRKLALSHLLMKKYGQRIILFQKFLYGLKTLVPIAIGLTKFNAQRFLIINFFSSIFFVSVLAYASYLSGEYIIAVANYVAENPIFAPITLLSVLGLVWYYFERTTKKGKRVVQEG